MRKIIVYYSQGGGMSVPSGSKFLIKSAKWVKVVEAHFGMYKANGENATFGTLERDATIYSSTNGLLIRTLDAVHGTEPLTICYTILKGDFETDSLEISTESLQTPIYPGRIEIRNEYGVLITDNGKPWPDGTYPPDAKNRAGLAGLHSAPIASSNDFADLSGLDPNKEVEMIGGERGEGMQYALERNDDNGL